MQARAIPAEAIILDDPTEKKTGSIIPVAIPIIPVAMDIFLVVSANRPIIKKLSPTKVYEAMM